MEHCHSISVVDINVGENKLLNLLCLELNLNVHWPVFPVCKGECRVVLPQLEGLSYLLVNLLLGNVRLLGVTSHAVGEMDRTPLTENNNGVETLKGDED